MPTGTKAVKAQILCNLRSFQFLKQASMSGSILHMFTAGMLSLFEELMLKWNSPVCSGSSKPTTEFAQPRRLSRAKWHKPKHTNLWPHTWVRPVPLSQPYRNKHTQNCTLSLGKTRHLTYWKGAVQIPGGLSSARWYVAHSVSSWAVTCSRHLESSSIHI